MICGSCGHELEDRGALVCAPCGLVPERCLCGPDGRRILILAVIVLVIVWTIAILRSLGGAP